MKKQFGAAFLLAGTAIGSGMISLPMVLAKFGIFNSCLLMIAFAALTYFTAIIRSELNLNCHAEATLSEVGKAFNCPTAGKCGDLLLKLLSFALMSAYIFGGASIIKSLIGDPIPIAGVVVIFSAAIALMFLLASDFIVHVNKMLFFTMFCAFIILVLTLLVQTPIKFIPNQADNILINQWTTLVPIIFTSFGFQGSIHSMTKFVKNDEGMIKNACLWGSLIPAFIYMIWTASVLLVVSNTDTEFFQQMLDGKATDVGKLVSILSGATSSEFIQCIIWIVSSLALITSIFGVGLALLDIFQREFRVHRTNSIALIVFLPAIISLMIPNAFIKILNVSGIILAMIAIIVPIVISWNMQKIQKGKCKMLIKSNFMQLSVLACGIGIIILGILDCMQL